MTVPTDLADAARRLNVVADLADAGHGRAVSGEIRQVCRWLAELHEQVGPLDLADDPDRCVCGRRIHQPPTGRRRKWCESCRPPRRSHVSR